MHCHLRRYVKKRNCGDMCAQRRFRSARICAFTQSEQNPHWGHFWQSKMLSFFTRVTKTLISLHVCTGWFESSLGADVRRCIISHCRSFQSDFVFFSGFIKFYWIFWLPNTCIIIKSNMIYDGEISDTQWAAWREKETPSNMRRNHPRMRKFPSGPL